MVVTDRPVTYRAIAAAMIQHGGGFVARLGAALQYADADNERLIREAWPEYWERYAQIAREQEGRA